MKDYIHHVPGRLRVKTATIRGNEQQALRLRQLLANLHGVLRHKVKTLTGSAVIYYDKVRIQGHTILITLIQHGFVKAESTLPPPQSVPSTAPALALPPPQSMLNPALALQPQPRASDTALPPRQTRSLLRLGSNLAETFGKVVFGVVLEKAAERSAMVLIKAIF